MFLSGDGISLFNAPFMKPILVLDNYDSFTYNLVHLLESLTDLPIEVRRNDALALSEIDRYGRILLSPGPGLPEEAGLMIDLIRATPEAIPILGICLGHQALAVASGGRLYQLPEVQHGISTPMRTIPGMDRLGLYQGLPADMQVGRYHSWMVDEDGLAETWLVNARDAQGRILSMVHAHRPVQGLQYHPESVMTPFGKQLLHNWLTSC